MKSKPKHTPAPWFIWEPELSTHRRDVDNLVIARSNPDDINMEIAYVNCDSGFFSTEKKERFYSRLANEEVDVNSEALANARLIAAAPELLWALERTVAAMFNAGPQDLQQEDDYLNYDNALIHATRLIDELDLD